MEGQPLSPPPAKIASPAFEETVIKSVYKKNHKDLLEEEHAPLPPFSQLQNRSHGAASSSHCMQMPTFQGTNIMESMGMMFQHYMACTQAQQLQNGGQSNNGLRTFKPRMLQDRPSGFPPLNDGRASDPSPSLARSRSPSPSQQPQHSPLLKNCGSSETVDSNAPEGSAPSGSATPPKPICT